MKKLTSIIVCIFSTISLLWAGDIKSLPFQDQLKLVRKIEFGKLDTGIGETFTVPYGFRFRNCQAIGSLVIEVDNLKLSTCLEAVQAKIKEGYDPNYPGDFDNSFLNDLMIGVLNQHEDHARRKIAFQLRNPVTDPDVSLPDEVLQTRNIMLCDVGLSQNHRYVGLNFWQEFVGNRELSDVAACFFLLDHMGNVLWHQEIIEISDPNWAEYKQKMRITKMSDSAKSNDGRMRGIFWYPGAVRDKEPVQNFIISNEGHVLTNHNIFGLWIDRNPPEDTRLRDKNGKTVYYEQDGAEYGKKPVFSYDASKLLYTLREIGNRKETTKCIDTNSGEVNSRVNLCFPDEKCKLKFTVHTHQSISSHKDELIQAEWKIWILDQAGKEVAETKISLNVQVSKEFEFYKPYPKEHYFNAKTVIDTKAGRFYVVSPVGFLEFQFAPLASSESYEL